MCVKTPCARASRLKKPSAITHLFCSCTPIRPHTGNINVRIKRKRGRSKSRIDIKLDALPLDYRRAKEEFISCYLTAALQALDLNITHTARTLRVSRRTLQLHISRLGLDLEGMR
jgi:DNA-binding NtrC family response regulator